MESGREGIDDPEGWQACHYNPTVRGRWEKCNGSQSCHTTIDNRQHSTLAAYPTRCPGLEGAPSLTPSLLSSLRWCLCQGRPLTTKTRPLPQPPRFTSGLLPTVHRNSRTDGRSTHSSTTDASLPSGLIVGRFALQAKPAAPN